MKSIRQGLIKRLVIPLLVINLIAAGLIYWLSWIPAQIALDQSLADAAWALIQQLKQRDDEITADLPEQVQDVLRVDHFDSIFLVVRNAAGNTILGDRDFPALMPSTQIDDPVAYDSEMRGEPVRVIALRASIGTSQAFVGAAETKRKRTHIHMILFLSLFVLEAAVTVLSIWIVRWSVNKGLHPLNEIQSILDQRSHDDLSPVSNLHAPAELSPMLNAMNNLLAKVAQSAAAQQNFLADVAHQLRTPLAGLKLQLEWLEKKLHDRQELTHSVTLMGASTDRMIRQTNQLLALARAEPSRFEDARLEDVALHTLIEESIQHFVEESDKKRIDLGFDLRPTMVVGDPFLLRDMIDNLIDNAIRYSPPSTKVTVSCSTQAGISSFAGLRPIGKLYLRFTFLVYYVQPL